LFKKVFVILLVFLLSAGCHSKTKEELLKDGVDLLNKDNPGGATVLFRNALEKDQNFFEARFQLARAYTAAKKYEQAEKEFLKVSAQSPSRMDVHVELGKLYILMQKPDKAIAEAEQYLQSKPDDPEALVITGKGFAMQGKIPEAEANLKKALSADPDRIAAKLALADVYESKGDHQGARALLNDVINKDKKNVPAYFMLAAIEEASGNPGDAVKIYQTVAEMHPDNITALYKMAMLNIRGGKLKDAEQTANNIVKKFPKRPEGHRLIGIIYYYEKKYADAVTELEASLRTQPNVGAFYFLGLSHLSLGELEQALSQLQKAVDIQPSFIDARLLIARILLKQKRTVDIIAVVQRAMRLDERGAIADDLLGGAYMGLGM